MGGGCQLAVRVNTFIATSVECRLRVLDGWLLAGGGRHRRLSLWDWQCCQQLPEGRAWLAAGLVVQQFEQARTALPLQW